MKLVEPVFQQFRPGTEHPVRIGSVRNAVCVWKIKNVSKDLEQVL